MVKKLISILSVCMFYQNPSAQSGNFMQDSIEWQTRLCVGYNGDREGIQYKFPYKFLVEGDTLIGDKACKKLYVQKGGDKRTAEYLEAVYEEGQKVAKGKSQQAKVAKGNTLASAQPAAQRVDTASIVRAATVMQSDAEASADSISAAAKETEKPQSKAKERKKDVEQLSSLLQQEKEKYERSLKLRTLWCIELVLVILFIATFLVLHYRLRMIRLQREHKRLLQQQEGHHQQRVEAVETQQSQQAEDVMAFLKKYMQQRIEAVQKLGQSVFLTPQEWKDVEHVLNAINGNCIAHVREGFPDLREEDIRLCILTLLGLSNRSIGNIYGLTISAVQHRKLKLKKDGFGESDADTTLEQVLARIKQQNNQPQTGTEDQAKQ